MGTRYLQGFIGENRDIYNWLDDKIDMWVEGIRQLPSVVGTYPYSDYASMQKSLQEKWILSSGSFEAS
jgi:hypothetical protein